MYNKSMLNKKMLLIIIFAVLLLIILGVLYFLNTSEKGNGGVFPTPTPYENPKNGSSGAVGPQNPTEIELSRRSAAVYALVSQIPIKGKDFSLYYSFKGDVFILYINPSQKELGNKEFDDYLKRNGVNDRSWMENLFTTYISPTPTTGAKNEISPTPAP